MPLVRQKPVRGKAKPPLTIAGLKVVYAAFAFGLFSLYVSNALSGEPSQSELVSIPVESSGDYVSDIETATQVYHPAIVGEVQYCPLDELSRPVCAYAELTATQRANARLEDRLPIEVDPPGWQGNREVVIPALDHVEGSRDYRGWFWNRSHLIADSLGGSAGPENLVTGTRMQNVGSTQTGGMAFTETIAREWLDQQQDDSCPLYYAATPEYVGEELVPRSVRVDMRSCDGAVDMGVTVLNTANGYGINYSTGEFTANH